MKVTVSNFWLASLIYFIRLTLLTIVPYESVNILLFIETSFVISIKLLNEFCLWFLLLSLIFSLPWILLWKHIIQVRGHLQNILFIPNVNGWNQSKDGDYSAWLVLFMYCRCEIPMVLAGDSRICLFQLTTGWKSCWRYFRVMNTVSFLRFKGTTCASCYK